MKVGFLALGKLGLPVALAVESRGHEVYAYDINPMVKTYLEKRKIPFREKDIQPLLDNHNITWCDTVEELVCNSDIIFLSIQTPHDPMYEGTTPLPEARADFDYSFLVAGIRETAQICANLDEPKTIAVISTCLPGTFRREIQPLLNDKMRYVYTPQFIAMGQVVEDYLYPEFNLVGIDDEYAADQLEEFYTTINDAPNVLTDITTAEGIKVSYNTWITTKTVIANAWGELSERLGMNFSDIKQAWDLSTKRLVSTRYMDAGTGDGGGCHPRDNIALSWLADETDMSHNIWEDLMAAREEHISWHCDLAIEAAEECDLPLVLLGKAFKPETDIETGSAAILMANILNLQGIRFLHTNDLASLPKAVYFIATKNARYADYEFPPGSVVLDPFGYIPDREGVIVKRIGRR